MRKLSIKNLILLVAAAFLCLGVLTTPGKTHAHDELEDLNKQIEEYETQLRRLKTEANTLTNQIAQFDAQINLTTSTILQTEQKIDLLGTRIERINASLEDLSAAFEQRMKETYKMKRVSDPVYMVLSSGNLSKAVMRFNYLLKVQEEDRILLSKLENTQTVYVNEKQQQEELQKQLEEQKQVLGVQKSAKNELLTITRNDEKKYQQMLAAALAEREAIQAIIAGKGEETEAGTVTTGQRIASVIPGPSACSSGAHLHFEVVKDGIHHSPAGYLSGKDVVWNNGPDSPFSFTGGWPWPLNDPIRITQGYGMTYYASSLRYYGGAPHTGIDMVNNGDYTVKSVKDGKLYRGSIRCGGGTLRYVRVEHDGGVSTYYLHVNY